jgi:hypothetical protein
MDAFGRDAAGRFINSSPSGPSPPPSRLWQTAHEFRYSASPQLISCPPAATFHTAAENRYEHRSHTAPFSDDPVYKAICLAASRLDQDQGRRIANRSNVDLAQ